MYLLYHAVQNVESLISQHSFSVLYSLKTKKVTAIFKNEKDFHYLKSNYIRYL